MPDIPAPTIPTRGCTPLQSGRSSDGGYRDPVSDPTGEAILVRDDEIYVSEINTIPGSLSWYLWDAAGVGRLQTLRDMIAEATAGPSRTFTTEGADGTALRSAGSIAAKLA